MIAKALQLGYSELGYNKKKELSEAITKTESYLIGYNKPYDSGSSFRRWFSHYE